MALRLTDFETEDQASLAKPPVQGQHPKTLLDFANQQHYRITGGYSPGTGHTKGSMHYQGNAKDPGAIDIDHKGVDYNKLLAVAKANGYNVLDEVRHPSAASTGPHYHISKARSGSKPTQAAAGQPKPKEISSQPNKLIAPFDLNSLQMPTTTDANGNFVVNQGKPQRNIGAEIGKAVKPEPKRQVSESISLSDFDLDQNDQAEIQAIADRLKPQPKPAASQPQQPPEKTNFFGDIYNHAVNAAAGYSQDDLIRHSGQGVGGFIGDTVGGLAPIGAGALSGAGLGALSFTPFGVGAGAVVGGIAGAGGAGVAQDLQAQRLSGAKELNIPRALGAGGIQAGLQAIPVVGKGLPLVQRIAANAALQGVGAGAGAVAQQGLEQGTLTPNIDAKRTMEMAALGAAGGSIGAGMEGKAHVQPKELPIPEPKYQKQADIIRNLGKLEGVPDKQALTPKDIEALQPKERTHSANPNVLNEAFAERQRPAEAPQIIDPRTQPLPKELGNIKTETTDGGVILATKAGEREIPQVETATAPTGERVYPTKELQTESILDPQTGQPYKPQERPLRSAHDAAMLRAEEIAKRTEDVNAPEPQRLPDNPATDIPNPASREVGQPLLDASGKPMAREIGTPTIERTGQPKPTDPTALELPKTYEKPQLREVGQVEPKAAVPEAQPGAYTDTLNELLKDSGLDFAGVQKLKADIDTRKSLLDTTLKNSRSDEAKRLRAELKDMTNRFKTLDPNIQEIAGQQFDPQTGIGQQRPLDKNSQFTLDQVRGNITPQTLPIAEQINKAMQNGTKVRLKYVAEQSGRSNEVAKLSKGGRAVVQTTEFSPTHFGYTNATFASGKKQMPVVHGYNQRGHEVMYYLDKSPKGSHIQQVVSVTDKPAFQGPVSNVHKGPGQYNVTDILSRGSRTERGFVKTSDAIKAIHEQKLAMREISNNAILPVESKQRFEKLYSGRDLSYDDLKSLSKDLSKPEKIAQFCKNLGLS